MIEDALNKAQAENARICERLNKESNTGGSDKTQERIPRPKGTAGTDFSIQEEMGLSGSTKGYDIYKGIQVRWESSMNILLTKLKIKRNLRDLMLNARINWERRWADVPLKDKALLFDVVNCQIPRIS